MDSIRIDTGIKHIAVNDDPNCVITFNPNDVAFAENFYQLMQDFQIKQVDYQTRADALSDQTALDQNNLPVNLPAGLALLREICEYMRERIDRLFGAGASQKAFGDTLDLNVFEQFFAGMTPIIQAARQEKTARYLTSKHAGKVMK